MNFQLMCREIPVASFTIDEATGRIVSDLNIDNREYLPLSVLFSDSYRIALQNWIDNRSASAHRKDVATMLAAYHLETPSALSFKSLGLNLSDQYWFKPEDADFCWHDVNLFVNEFAEQSFKSVAGGDSSSYTPDSSSNGDLPKFWKIEQGKRFLYKEGSAPFDQQPYNEVFASKLLDVLNLPHVSYSLEQDDAGEKAYSVCETFVTPETEYVPALEILGVVPRLNHENSYQHFGRCIEKLSIPVSRREIDEMLMFDYLINNADRHYGNFGFIREVSTRKFLGMAPIFDNGNSLWYLQLNKRMKFKEQPAKPFRDIQTEQLKLLGQTELLVENLTEELLQRLIVDIYSKNDLFDAERMDNLLYNVTVAARRIADRQYR